MSLTEPPPLHTLISKRNFESSGPFVTSTIPRNLIPRPGLSVKTVARKVTTELRIVLTKSSVSFPHLCETGPPN